MKSLLPKILTAIVVLFLITTNITTATTLTWVDWGGTGLWNTPGTGSGDGSWDDGTGTFIGIPVAGDIVVFDGNSNTPCTIDITTAQLAGFQINTGYTSTITQGVGITVNINSGTANFILSDAATFTGSASNITISGAYTQSAGFFNSTTGFLNIGGNFTLNGGTFTPGTGTVNFNSNNLAIYNTPSFYNLRFTNANNTSGLTYTIDQSITVTNNFNFFSGGASTRYITLNKGAGAGIINLKGNITGLGNCTSTSGGGTATIILNGAGAQSIAGSTTDGAVPLCNLEFNSTTPRTFTLTNYVTVNGLIISGAGGNITVNGGTALNVLGDITVSNTGTAGGGTSNIIIKGTGTQTFTGNATAGQGLLPFITINKSSGTLNLANTISTATNLWTYTAGAISVGTSTVSFNASASISGAMSFNNLLISSGTLTGNAGNMNIAGAFTNNGTFTHNSGTVSFNGATASIAGSSATTFNNLTISSGTLNGYSGNTTILGNFSNSGTYTQASGTVTFSGTTVMSGSVPSFFNVTIAGALTLPAAGINVAGDWSHTSGVFTPNSAPVTFNGAAQAISCTAGTETFYGIVFGGTSTKTLGSHIIATQNLTINPGSTLDVSATPYNVFIAGNFINDGTVTPQLGTFTFNGGSTQTISGSGSAAVGAFTMNNTGGISKTGSNLTVTNAFTIFSANNFNNSSGSLTLNGSFSLGGGSFTANTSGNTVIIGYNGAIPVTTGGFYNLTIATGSGGAGIKTLPSATVLAADLTINGSNTLDLNGYNLNVAGNWSDLGTFTAGPNTVTFDGGNQTITKSGGETFGGVIFAGTLTKTLGSDITTNDLTISSTLDVTATPYMVNVKGNWINNGAFTANTGTVTLIGTGPGTQSIGGTGITSFYNVTLNNTFGASLSSAQKLIGTLTLTSGIFDTNGQPFTLISNAAGTARIATIPAANFVAHPNPFPGNLTMQRYISQGTDGWIMLGTPVIGATLQQWNDSIVTGGFPGSDDPSGVTNSSILGYDETVVGIFDAGWTVPTNITDVIGTGQGYSAYVINTTAAAKTLAVTGPISTNTFNFHPTYTTTSGGPSEDGWNVFSNPYPSTIDWEDVGNWVKSANMSTTIYMYNAFDDRYSEYSIGGASLHGGTNLIASSQSFIIQATSAAPLPDLQVSESAKTTGDVFVRSPFAIKDHLLKLDLIGNGFTDETIVRFKAGATNAVDIWDARKFYSSNYAVPDMATFAGTHDMSINSFPILTGDLNVPLLAKVGVSGTYIIKVDSSTNMPGNSCLVLEDLLTHTFTDLRTSPSYSFYISDTTASPRFIIHFGKPVDVSVASTPKCNGASTAILTAKGNGTGPWNYIWKNDAGDTIQTHLNINGADTLKNSSAGLFTVSIAGNTGLCSGLITETILVTEPDPLYAQETIQNTSCTGDANGGISIALAGGYPPYNYSWSNGDTTSGISNVPVGTYSLTVSDTNDCSQQYSYNVLQNSTLVCDFNMNTDTVHLPSSSPVVFSNSSVGVTTFSWNFGDGSATDISPNPVHTYLLPGTYNVSLTVTDGNCYDTLVKQIIVTPDVTTVIHKVTDIDDLIKVKSNGNSIELTFNLNESTRVSVEVFNAIGEKVFTPINETVYKNSLTFDFSVKAKGVYFIKIQAGNQIIMKKLLN